MLFRSWETDRTLVDLVLARSGSNEPAPLTALQSGFLRLNAGTTQVVVDAGSPPGRGMDELAHAGTLSFEMSAAHERLVVNCGIYPGAPVEWRRFMRYTAAHSTAVVDDTNSTEITDHGAMEYRAGNVLIGTVSSSFPAATVREIGRQVLETFREAQLAQLPLAELVVHYGSLKITARELRGGALVFLTPATPSTRS